MTDEEMVAWLRQRGERYEPPRHKDRVVLAIAARLAELSAERDAAQAEVVEARAAILYALQLGDEDRRFFLNRWWDGEGDAIRNEYSWDGAGPGWPEFLAEFRAALAERGR